MHAQVEEEIFYPWLRENLDEDDMEMVEEAQVEHNGAKDLIAQIEGAHRTSTPTYDAKVKVLCEYIKHHVKEEENEIFPAVSSEKDELDELGQEMASRKEELDRRAGPRGRGRGRGRGRRAESARKSDRANRRARALDAAGKAAAPCGGRRFHLQGDGSGASADPPARAAPVTDAPCAGDRVGAAHQRHGLPRGKRAGRMVMVAIVRHPAYFVVV